MTRLGDLVAAGRTSDVYEFGSGAVVKVPRPQVPDHWAPMEAAITTAVRRLDVPAPAVIDVTQVDGRNAIVFERIAGRPMWEQMLDDPRQIPALARLLADTQRRISEAGPPDGLDGLVDRISRKLNDAHQLTTAERSEADELAEALPRGAALLHGDLHPGNVLMTQDGPVAIDWFDASIGHPVADVVRSSLLIRPTGGRRNRPHLPGADDDMLHVLHRSYVEAMIDVLDAPPEILRQWEAVMAASRLSEGTHDEPAMLDLWNTRHHSGPSVLVDAVTAASSRPANETRGRGSGPRP